MVKWFDKLRNVKRRGGFLPGRFRFSSRSGVTLVELMISMLILAIVCISWLQIIGIQSARKEARRREAVERLAGMMDAFMYDKLSTENNNDKDIKVGAFYTVGMETNKLSVKRIGKTEEIIKPVFGNNESSIGYSLQIAGNPPDVTLFENWQASYFLKGKSYDYTVLWLIGKLYDHCGDPKTGGEPFFTIPVCLTLVSL